MSCSQEETKQTADSPIKLSACIGENNIFVTRSADETESQNEYFDANTLIRAYIYQTATNTPVQTKEGVSLPKGTDYKALPHISRYNTEKGQNELMNSMDFADHDNEPNFPVDQTIAVDVVALHPSPSVSTFAADTESGNLTFTVRSSQTTSADYKASDLMLARETGKLKSASPIIRLNFSHQMAKVTINYQPGKGEPAITKVEILGIKPTVTIDRFDRTSETPISTSSGDETSIVIYNNEAGYSEEYTVSAIVPAQTEKPVNTEFVRFSFLGGGTATFKLKEAVSLSAGKQYIYRLKVNVAEIECTSGTVKSWTYGDTKSRDVEI